MGSSRQTVLVVGLGRFGNALASELSGLGHSVVGVDLDPRLVQTSTECCSHVAEVDATDADALRQLIDPGDVDVAVVAIGSGIEASVLATHVLVKTLRIRKVWAKAITNDHGRVLEAIGAHKVIFPERDMGVRVAHSLTGRAKDYLELEGEDFVLVETTVPRAVAGKRLADAEVRSRHGVTIVAIKPEGGRFSYATQDSVIHPEDLLLIAGAPDKAAAFAALD